MKSMCIKYPDFGYGRLACLLLFTMMLLSACSAPEIEDAAQPSSTMVSSSVQAVIPSATPELPSPTPNLPTMTAISPTETTAATATSTPSPEPTTNDEEAIMETSARANADVQFVRTVQAADGTWTFHVTVAHPDTGWEDYADGWDVYLADGTILKSDGNSPFTRLLLHPHETEQPFTRSQSGIRVPEGVTEVWVRAHDLVDGFGGRVVLVDLAADSGPDFAVER
jgi:hypothetical protein